MGKGARLALGSMMGMGILPSWAEIFENDYLSYGYNGATRVEQLVGSHKFRRISK